MKETYLSISPEVKEAQAAGKPVVALESTIISHGMPYPQNVEMAKQVEQIIRDNGATPATVAIMDGKIKIGLTEEDLERLASEKDVAKVSRRDMAEVIAKGGLGATTVTTTMIGAHMAGIDVFVTGGLGGVHRGYNDHMDVSADLEELGQTPVTVVCAGAKAILDLPRTLEYLETKGVPVVGYQTDKLPAFFSSSSDYELNTRADSPEEIARMMKISRDLELGQGMLVTNPIKKEDEIPHEEIDQIIDQAIREADEAGVQGKDITPFLLAKIVELTDGRSLDANIKLVYNNAVVGAQIAVAYNEIANS
ncbi:MULTISPECIES: pseudouridine-5'-phosphate glycosidase [Aerococcus]|uniref:Pseudouridine-5'-phosphate glycosidase n=1 Tax=Aerococcus sanguinicola TaxID=119206 RepID=A0A5N1GP89_9LACT|nr:MULTISPECIES: pseudouridine-5'-phosphate glycosidase [Aerococcus]KAA9302079.1 pseudouridine-5'-phosphate glycosidase [Aerococcus sanguinicola]MDK6368495.1 pseudouridine-5'-phosphate glycosidase [Aerococcus sp. UMB9870]MDK6679578.1 pseudouridine-5'-phosphate glycosidase [Aerococcus sp. UMB8608]MDK6686422.1 pseudouridine-5'-phosphate glycosidase [Aerococcus sp. UMB8623]MDK6940956.1 pseudouridine-5'-phosphate glycosidase [Aerococcus sp. UMB8487]